jgi:hypothetical protein
MPCGNGARAPKTNEARVRRRRNERTLRAKRYGVSSGHQCEDGDRNPNIKLQVMGV